MAGGAGDWTDDGGEASALFDDVTVKKALEVATGVKGTGTCGGGNVSFEVRKTLAAPEIILRRADATGTFNFGVDTLAMTAAGADATIGLEGILSADISDIDVVNIGYGSTLTVTKDTVAASGSGVLATGALNVGAGQKAGLRISEFRTVTVDGIGAPNAEFTIYVPTGYTGAVPVANVINTADFDNGTVILDCDIDCFAKASQNASTPPEPVRAATLYAACTEFLIRDDEDYPLRRDVTFILDVGSSLVPSSPLFRSVKARLKALSEGHAASAAFLSNASGLVAGDGITQAVSAASDAGPSFFTFISYDNSRYCTGLSSDVKGLSLLFGASCGADVSAGRLTVAAFFESGDVDHDPFNDFAGPGSVRGTCNAEHVGGLLLVRLDLAKSDAGFTCADASFRAGRASVAFRNVEFGSEYSYDLKSNYSGFHVGVGHVFNVTDSTSIDFCGNWLFTRQGGNEHVACGERIRFDDVSSRRLRAGIRLTAAIPGTVKPFFGVGCEHELDGRARARIRDLPADVPELKGGSGIGEIGLSVAATDSLTLDIGVLGSAGTRPASAGQ